MLDALRLTMYGIRNDKDHYRVRRKGRFFFLSHTQRWLRPVASIPNMNPLLAVIPFHNGDLKSARTLLDWINELGGAKQHACLLVADAAVTPDERKVLLVAAAASFKHAAAISVIAQPVGYPPNRMFLSAARHIHQCYKYPWLWLEPDCVPLKSGWLDTLAAAYAESPKRFMGCLVESTQPGIPKKHLPGCSIYPQDAFPIYDTIEGLRKEIIAWDMESAATVVPRAAHTPLIQHFWGKRNLPPSFIEKKQPGLTHPENTLDLSFIQPGAVLFHRCKDGSLLRLLEAIKRKQHEHPLNPVLDRLPLHKIKQSGQSDHSKAGKPADPAPVTP